MVPDDHGSQMTGKGVALEILATLGTVLQMTDRIATEATVTGTAIATGQATPETLVGTGETEEHGQGVQSGGTGTAIIGMTTSIGGVSYDHDNEIASVQDVEHKASPKWRLRPNWRIFCLSSVSRRQGSNNTDAGYLRNGASGVCSISLEYCRDGSTIGTSIDTIIFIAIKHYT